MTRNRIHNDRMGMNPGALQYTYMNNQDLHASTNGYFSPQPTPTPPLNECNPDISGHYMNGANPQSASNDDYFVGPYGGHPEAHVNVENYPSYSASTPFDGTSTVSFHGSYNQAYYPPTGNNTTNFPNDFSVHGVPPDAHNSIPPTHQEELIIQPTCIHGHRGLLQDSISPGLQNTNSSISPNGGNVERNSTAGTSESGQGNRGLGNRRRPRRPRTIYTPSQLESLNSSFSQNAYLNLSARAELANNLGLTQTQVKIWFQNHRSKLKKMQRLMQARSEGTSTPNFDEPRISDSDDEENSRPGTSRANSMESVNSGYNQPHQHHKRNNNWNHSGQRSPEISPRTAMQTYNVPYTTASPNENLPAAAVNHHSHQAVTYYTSPGLNNYMTAFQRGNFEWQAGAAPMMVSNAEVNPAWDVTNTGAFPRGVESHLATVTATAYECTPHSTSSPQMTYTTAQPSIQQPQWSAVKTTIEDPQYQAPLSTDTSVTYGYPPSQLENSVWQGQNEIPEAEF
nr:Distal-less [Hymenolepis microstoma]